MCIQSFDFYRMLALAFHTQRAVAHEVSLRPNFLHHDIFLECYEK